MLDSLKLCGEVAGNYQYQTLWEKVRDEVTAGRRICEALRGTPLVPPVLIQMIASGEETGKLDFVLERVSSYYDREVEMAIKTATSLIEPIMIAAMDLSSGESGWPFCCPSSASADRRKSPQSTYSPRRPHFMEIAPCRAEFAADVGRGPDAGLTLPAAYDCVENVVRLADEPGV